MKKILSLMTVFLLFIYPAYTADNASDNLSIPYTFSSGETISSNKMNANFHDLLSKIIELDQKIYYLANNANIIFYDFSSTACELNYYYGSGGIGINNGMSCSDICSNQGGSSIDWDSIDEQTQYCLLLHPYSEIFVATPNSFSYPLWQVQNNKCHLNQDGSKVGTSGGVEFTGNGTNQYGDQILCKCQKQC